MVDKPLNVPLVPSELRREETIQQICDSLQYLDNVAQRVFTSISSKVAENRRQLQTINDRILTAQARIDTLKGSNKATQVFAGAKYPAAEEERMYTTVFTEEEKLKYVTRPGYKVRSKFVAVDEKMVKDKLQFFNVKLKSGSKPKLSQVQEEGLGHLPPNLNTVSSLLLFNTSENP